MDAVVVGLLVSLLVVLGLTLAFFTVYRRERRKIVREASRLEPLVPFSAERRRPVPFLLPPRWLAIRSSNTAVVRDSIGGDAGASVPWSEALARLRERRVFVRRRSMDGRWWSAPVFRIRRRMWTSPTVSSPA